MKAQPIRMLARLAGPIAGRQDGMSRQRNSPTIGKTNAKMPASVKLIGFMRASCHLPTARMGSGRAGLEKSRLKRRAGLGAGRALGERLCTCPVLQALIVRARESCPVAFLLIFEPTRVGTNDAVMLSIAHAEIHGDSPIGASESALKDALSHADGVVGSFAHAYA